MIPNQLRAKTLYLVIAFVFSMLLLNSSLASAQDNWFTDDFKWAYDSFYYDTWNSKVACEPETSHCVAIVYDDIGLFTGRAVHVYYSTDYFQSVVTDEIISPCFYDGSSKCQHCFHDYITNAQHPNGWNLNDSLPMDIIFRTDDNKYWMTIGSDVYTFSITDSPKVTLQYNLYARNEIMGILNENEIYSLFWRGSSPMVQPQIKWLVNGTTKETWADIINTNLQCSPESGTCMQTNLAVRGFVPRDRALANTSHAFWSIVHLWDIGSGCLQWQSPTKNSVSMGTFPTDYNGLWFYLNNYMYYRRLDNATGNVSGGVWKAFSSDLSSYGSAELVYAENESVEEYISFAYGVRTNNYNVFQSDKLNNRTTPFALLSGVYSFREQLNSVKVTTMATDPITEEDLDVTSTAILNCTGTNYTYTDTGESYDLYTICDDDVKVSLYVSEYQPVAHTTIFSFDSGLCPTLFMDAHYFKPYRAYIKVIDTISGDPVSGATVEIDSLTNTTDASGWTSFLITPVNVNNFSMTYAEGSCLIDLRPTGELKPYYIRITSTGYTTYLETNLYFATGTTIGNTTFYEYEDVMTFQLDRGATYQIKVRTDDGIEVYGSGVIVTTSGANQTFLEVGGTIVETNQAISFPAFFRLVDDRPSYTVYFNLTQGNFTDSYADTVVNTTSHYLYTFYIPDQQCQTVGDCVDSYCIGSYFYEVSACSSYECVYDVETCFLFCDDESGCHEGETTEACYFDVDCTDECIDAGNLKVSSCGVNNICVEHSTECPYGCVDVVEGEDYCESAPDIAYCDQSTVTGMLTCLQAGILGFISGTYDPMMYLVVTIFLVIIVVSMISLAFRGTQRVIR